MLNQRLKIGDVPRSDTIKREPREIRMAVQQLEQLFKFRPIKAGSVPFVERVESFARVRSNG